ncbi:CPBP family intramembrane glutamic endopeptidase [Halalkalibacter alkalisediminis]|uniref:Lysostaphin resistance A-like protein n=1 Tax=Halalkalibacter alkalisediminis TaxID=935616 RepID=A0ABV6NBK9_9BACI
MNQRKTFYSGLLLAFSLLYVSFHWQPLEFWVLFPLSLFCMTVWSWLLEPYDLKLPSIRLLLSAIGSGILLYSFFAFGKWFVLITGLPLLSDLESLFTLVKPTEPIHYLWLFFIVIPGEEWFWRGFIVKRLTNHLSVNKAAVYGTTLYAGAHLATGSLLLVLAALLAGLAWSFLYVRSKSIWVPILSHLIFDLFLLVLFPLI